MINEIDFKYSEGNIGRFPQITRAVKTLFSSYHPKIMPKAKKFSATKGSKNTLTKVIQTAVLVGFAGITSSLVAGDGSIDTTARTLDLNVFFAYSETDENLSGPNTTDTWRSVFNDASSRLWNATNGQLKIGTVRVYRRALSRKDDADVWVLH